MQKQVKSDGLKVMTGVSQAKRMALIELCVCVLTRVCVKGGDGENLQNESSFHGSN